MGALVAACISGPCTGASGSPRLLELRVYGGVHAADYSTVGGEDLGFGAARTSLGLDLAGPLSLRADGLVGQLGSNVAGAGALRAYAHDERFLLGGSFTHTALSGGLTSDMFALHGEVYEADWMTATSSFGFEKKTFGDLLFAEVFLRFYVGPSVLLATGASYAVAAIKQTRADIVFRGEWTFYRSACFSPALFLQVGGNVFSRASAGITFYFDDGGYTERERRDGLFMARFD